MLQRAPGMLQSGRARGAVAPGRRVRIALAGLQLLTAVVFVAPFLFGGRTRGFPLDDAWIHQVVARTFAETGTLGYVPGAYGTGATSYLWAALLAIGQKLSADPVIFTGVLGLAGSLGVGQALLTLIEDGERDRTDVVAVALACAGGDLTWFAFSGMEASFVAAAGLAAIAFATGPDLAREADPRSARRAALLAGSFAGVAALTRPDFVPLGGGLVALVFVRRRNVREAAVALAPWALACVLYFGSNALLAGTPMPATMKGRRWLWIDSVQGKASAASLAVDFAFAWAYRLRQFTLGLESNLALWIAGGLAVGGAAGAVRRRRLGLVVAAAFALFHALVFVAVLPVPGHGGRYQPLVPVLFVLFAVLGTFELARALARVAPHLARPAHGLALLVWVPCVGNAFWEWHLAHRDAVMHIEKAEVGAGRAVAALPPEAVVASFDVGAIGWFSKRKLLDLGALTTPKVMIALEEDAVVDLLRREKVTHLVLPAGEDPEFPDLSNFGFRLRVVDHPELELKVLSEHFSDHDTWIRGAWYVQNATFRQRVYQVTPIACDVAAACASMRASLGGKAEAARAEAGVSAVPSVPPALRARFDRGFAQAAARGLCVRVVDVLSPSVAPAGDACFDVRLHHGTETPPPGAKARVHAELAGMPAASPVKRDDVVRELARLTAAYDLAGDAAGAAGAALHAVAAAARAAVPCFWTPLPALDVPLPPDFHPPPDPRDSAAWGFVVLLLVGAAVAAAARPREVA